MQWFKLFCEWASDPKVQTMTEAMRCRLVMLWCLCCTTDPAQLTDRERAAWLRISLRELRKTHAAFVSKGFMEEDWSMPKFEARQTPADPTAAERMRRYRRNRAAPVARNGPPPGPVTVAPRAQGSKARMGGETIETAGARPPEHSRHGPTPDPIPAPPDPPTPWPDPTPDPVPDPPDPPDPAWADVARYAGRLGGPAWSTWAFEQHRHYPADWVKRALEIAEEKAALRLPFVTGVLKSFRDQGGPDRTTPAAARPASEGRSGGPVAPSEIRPPFIPEGPEGDAVRAMYSEAPAARSSGQWSVDGGQGRKDPPPVPADH